MAAQSASPKRHLQESDTDQDGYTTDQESSKQAKKKKRAVPVTRLSGISDKTLDTLQQKHPGVFIKCRLKSGLYVSCTLCNTSINLASGTKEADNHTMTAKHSKNAKARKGQRDLFNTGMKSTGTQSSPQLNAEIILSQWIAGSNLPFVKATELTRWGKCI